VQLQKLTGTDPQEKKFKKSFCNHLVIVLITSKYGKVMM